MEKRGGAVDKAPHFYIKSRTTDPRSAAHEIHTPGGTLICIPRTPREGIPPVARCAVAHCRAMCCPMRSIDATPTKSERSERAETRTREARPVEARRISTNTRSPVVRVQHEASAKRERARTWTICDGPHLVAVLCHRHTRARHADDLRRAVFSRILPSDFGSCWS